MDQPEDLFENLDRDLMEIFQRNHYADFFRGVPIEDHNRRLDHLNELIRRRRAQESQNQYIKLIWLLNVIPLPVVKYRRVWRDFNITQAMLRLISVAIISVTRIFRFTMFLLGSSIYIQRIAQTLFMFGNELTYSTNFFRDVFTYSFRHNTGVFKRYELIHTKGIRYSLVLSENFEIISIFQYFKRVLYHVMLAQINHKCTTSDGQATCVPDDTSLIFKFHDIFRSRFDLSDEYFTGVVVAIYLSYALIGNLICMNIFYLYSLNIVNRASKFSSYLGKLAVIIWNSSRELC